MKIQDWENWEPPRGQLEAIVENGFLKIKRCINGIPIDQLSLELEKVDE